VGWGNSNRGFAIRNLDFRGANRRVTGLDLWVAADGAGRGELCVTATAYDNIVVNSSQVTKCVDY